MEYIKIYEKCKECKGKGEIKESHRYGKHPGSHCEEWTECAFCEDGYVFKGFESVKGVERRRG